jgi:hypothetical protein
VSLIHVWSDKLWFYWVWFHYLPSYEFKGLQFGYGLIIPYFSVSAVVYFMVWTLIIYWFMTSFECDTVLVWCFSNLWFGGVFAVVMVWWLSYSVNFTYGYGMMIFFISVSFEICLWSDNFLISVSLRYGYGLMNATAMVDYGSRWINVPPKYICTVLNGIDNV